MTNVIELAEVTARVVFTDIGLAAELDVKEYANVSDTPARQLLKEKLEQFGIKREHILEIIPRGNVGADIRIEFFHQDEFNYFKLLVANNSKIKIITAMKKYYDGWLNQMDKNKPHIGRFTKVDIVRFSELTLRSYVV